MSGDRLTRFFPARGSILLAVVLVLAGCGYHTVGSKSAQLPASVHSIAIPAFANRTHTYHVEQVLTEAVVREFLARTQYRIVYQDNGSADAVLRGVVTAANIQAVTSDLTTGRATTALITVNMRVSLVDRGGKMLYENVRYSFREQYEISNEPAAFFQESSPAINRLAQDFARTLVSNILESY
jgi:outer membrane lipopolysaccharide assembly protein LptE/RlpB